MNMILVSEDALESIKRMAQEEAKDAARYRWLRSASQDVAGPAAYGPFNGPVMFDDVLDAAIDEAMQAKPC